MDSKALEILKKLEPVRVKLLKDSYTALEYKELVLAMGVTEWEWNNLQANYGDFMARAAGFIKHAMPEEAIKELDAAILIIPNDFDLHFAYSQAYLQLWKKQQTKNYEQKTEFHARKCLQINSENEKAIRILAQLQNKKASSNRTFETTSRVTNNKKGGNKFGLWAAGIALSLACFIGYLALPGNAKRGLSEMRYEGEEAADVKDNKKDVEVTFDIDKKYPNIEFILQKSMLETYDYAENTYYRLLGYLVLKNYEASTIELGYELFNDADEIIHRGRCFVSFPKGARAGDKLPLFAIEGDDVKTLPEAVRANLFIKNIKRKTALSEYPEAKTLDVDWKIKKTEEINLSLKERNSEIGYNKFSKKILHSLTIAVENKGTATIKKIKMNIIWLDAVGEKLGNHTFYLIGSTTPYLESTYIVPYYTVLSVKHPKGTEAVDYKLELLDVEFE